ncbi:Fibronectin type-III domain-containing protein OS=Rhodanobacter lindaniclasticus OX=75310 GN=B1991_13375 PE=4 SV=1 [Rhodanobacter lindaniclasticus]
MRVSLALQSVRNAGPKGKNMGVRRQGIGLWAVVLFAWVGAGHAQTAVTPEDEYKKLIRVSQDIQPLSENPFGEQVSLYNGSLSFVQTDVSLPGNGPVLQVSRSFRPVDKKESATVDGGFADWDLEIPRITTLAATQWLVAGSSPRSRCSQFGLPPTIAGQQGGADWEPATWWSGYQLVVPGEGSQDLLRRAAQNTLSPSMGGSVFGIVTTHHWMITCGVATDDPVGDPGGEGFLAVTPDGTRYWFTHLVYRWAATMERPMGTGPLAWRAIGVQPQIALEDRLIRRQASMLVSRIEDRFGNSLTYSYNGAQLTAITASDGRQVTLSYVSGTDRIGTISVAPASGPTRTWSYQYSTALTPLLSQVTLPDGSAWSYDLAGLRNGETLLGEGDCDNLGALSTNVPSGSMVHPSGLTGTFQITPVVRGRSYVPRQCRKNADDSSYAHIPRAYATLAITRKTFSGAGLPTRSWNYGYSPANASWLQDCTGGCTSTVWTDVVDPDGHATRHTFSNRFDETEGQLQRVDRYSAAIGTPVLRAEVDQYAASDAGPWPSVYGDNLQSRMNAAVVGRQVPLNQRVIGQDGDSYTWQAEAFNAFAQVTQTKQYNSIAGQGLAQEQTAYRNDTALWVLGLPLTVTHLATGEVESANTYDTSNDTLLTRARFGQTLMSYTFNSAGQLASFTDGNNHTTTLGNYKRGIPQAIGYPDGTSQAVAVDDFGQIGAITDQAGHTTHYSYDPAGRITGISYPTGDEVAWLPTTFTYDFVTSAERGMAANHWRRTTTTGNATAVTTFDAMLRPVLSDSAIGSVVQASTLSTYNANGQQVFSAYPSAMALTFALSPTVDGSTTSYDALGHVTQVAQDSELGVLTRRTAYLSGARQQVTDAKGNLTTTSYQVFDQPSYEAVTQVQAPTGITQTIARDGYGNPLSITQSGLYGTETNTVIKTLIYDSAHRLCRTTEPESGSTVMDYDGANDLAWSAAGLAITGSGCGREQVAAAARTTRSYDAMNRLLTLLPPAGTQSTSYTYDALGRPTTAVSGISRWSGTYNDRGMPTGESLQVTGQGRWSLGYAHDAYGHLNTLRYPNNESVSYTPDALGRSTQAGGYASSVTYFPDGKERSYTLGNGMTALRDENTRQLPSNLSYGPGASLRFSEDYHYDANGNLTSVVDLYNGQNDQTLGYDALNRLIAASAPNAWGTQTYAYDALNNLRQNVNGGYTINMNLDANNRLTSVTFGTTPFTTYQNDARGNRSAMTYNGVTTPYSFDAKNQLLEVSGVASYAYDAAGRRIMKTPAVGGAAAAIYSFYNQAGQLLYGCDAATAQGTNYIHLNGKLIARHKGTITTYLLTDRLGSQHGLRDVVGVYRLAQAARRGHREQSRAQRTAGNRREAPVQPRAIHQGRPQHGPRAAVPAAGGGQCCLAVAQLARDRTLGRHDRFALALGAHRAGGDDPRRLGQRCLRQPFGQRLQGAETDDRRQRRQRRHVVRQAAAQPSHTVQRRSRLPAQRQHRLAGGAQARQQEVADLAAAADDQHRHEYLTDRPADARPDRSRADGSVPACVHAPATGRRRCGRRHRAVAGRDRPRHWPAGCPASPAPGRPAPARPGWPACRRPGSAGRSRAPA